MEEEGACGSGDDQGVEGARDRVPNAALGCKLARYACFELHKATIYMESLQLAPMATFIPLI